MEAQEKAAAFAGVRALPGKRKRRRTFEPQWANGRRPADLLPAMAVGAEVHFELPANDPERRLAYKAVSRSAFYWLGAGNYKLRGNAAGVMLTRLGPKP